MNAGSNRLVIASPYKEGAIRSIAQGASMREQLSCFYTTLNAAKLTKFANRVPVARARQRLLAEFQRRAFDFIPGDSVDSVAQSRELIHLVARRLPGAQRLASSLMYNVKHAFDEGVARKLADSHHWDGVITIYDAALATLQVAKETDRFGVLHFVNSHPAAHNQILKLLAGLESPHHELIPPLVHRRVERELELAQLILVPSQFVGRQIIEQGVPADKIAVEPYGVDLRAFQPTQRDSHVGKTVKVLYVGQISHRKGIKILLEAAKQFRGRGVEFELIGPLVSPEVLDRMPSNAQWAGTSPHGGVAAAMRHADIFVLPTLEDACALVTIEAMAAGLPVITTSNNGASERILQWQNGVVIAPGEIVALINALQRLIESPDDRERIGRAAREAAEAELSWDAYGSRVIEMINQRVAANRQRQLR